MEKPEKVSAGRMIELEEELVQLKKEYGIIEKPRLWMKAGDWIVGRMREPVRVSRKKYVALALTVGWFSGAHRFYTKSYIWGILYILFCWTGFSIAMTMVDLITVFLKCRPDEEGMILV